MNLHSKLKIIPPRSTPILSCLELSAMKPDWSKVSTIMEARQVLLPDTGVAPPLKRADYDQRAHDRKTGCRRI